MAKIKSEYRDVCCYQLDRVFEVMPTGGNGWAATLGSEQIMLRFGERAVTQPVTRPRRAASRCPS